MKKLLTVIIAFFVCVLALAGQPKYIFYFIGDGMSIPGVAATEMYNAAAKGSYDPEPLTFSAFPYKSFVSSYNTQNLVTDSAAAGSALSCGEKTYAASICMDKEHQPMKTITEKFKNMGWGTGVITTVGINHATPAAFYANAENRNSFNDIFDQLLRNGIVDFAAGADILVDKNGKRTGQDGVKMAQKAGWNVLMEQECLTNALQSDKTLCIDRLGSKDMGYIIDRKRKITLSDFTSAAIQNLEKYHPESFFIMIEGGNIDHAAHSGDGAAMIVETNDMDRAVDVAMAFYRQHPQETLILVTSDHETGGLSLGCTSEYAIHPQYLLCQKISLKRLTKKIKGLRNVANVKWDDAKQVLKKYLGLWDSVEVSPEQEKEFIELFERTIKGKDRELEENLYSKEEKLASEAVKYLNRKAGLIFSHNAHSGSYVPVYAIGCGAEQIVSCRHNNDIPNTIMKLVEGK